MGDLNRLYVGWRSLNALNLNPMPVNTLLSTHGGPFKTGSIGHL